MDALTGREVTPSDVQQVLVCLETLEALRIGLDHVFRGTALEMVMAAHLTQVRETVLRILGTVYWLLHQQEGGSDAQAHLEEASRAVRLRSGAGQEGAKDDDRDE